MPYQHRTASRALLGDCELGCELPPACLPASPASGRPQVPAGVRPGSGVPATAAGRRPGDARPSPWLAGDSRAAQQFRVSGRGHRRGSRRPGRPRRRGGAEGGPRASASREAPGREEASPRPAGLGDSRRFC